jgi:hypothetical protein
MIPTPPPAGPLGFQQRLKPDCRGPYPELRDFPATDQAIRADRPAGARYTAPSATARTP